MIEPKRTRPPSRPPRSPRTNAAPLARLAALSLLLALPTPSPAATKVVKKPLVVTRHVFDPAAPPPAKMPPLGHGEDAVTATGYGVGTQLRKMQTTRRQADGTYRTSVSVDGLQLEVQMTIDVWVPTDASDKLKAHEEGHRQISERVYAEVADRAARVAGDAVDGRRFTGEGKTAAEAEAAATAAVGAAIDAANKAYLAETDAPARQVQAEYDALTRHGTVRELAEADAIRQSWDKYPPRLWVPPKPPAAGPAGAAAKPATRPAVPVAPARGRTP